MAKIIGLTAIFGLLPIGTTISLCNGSIGGYLLSGVIALAAYLFYGPRIPFPGELRSQIHIPLLLFVSWGAISLLWCPSENIAKSTSVIITLALITGQLHIMFTFTDNDKAIAYVFFIYSLVIVVFIGGTILGLTPWECVSRGRYGRFTAGISANQYLNENEVANQAGAATIMMFYMFSRYRHLFMKIISVSLGLACFAIMIMSGSRGALVGIGGSLLGLAVICREEIFSSSKNCALIILCVTLVLFIAVLFSDTLLNTSMAQRFLEKDSLEQGFYGRLDVITGAIQYVFCEGHLFGKGGMASFTYYSEHYGREFVPHCMPIAMLADLGLVGLLVYALVCWQLYKSIRSMRPGNEKLLCIALSLFALIVTARRGGGYTAGWTWCIFGLITTVGYRMRKGVVPRKMPNHVSPPLPKSFSSKKKMEPYYQTLQTTDSNR